MNKHFFIAITISIVAAAASAQVPMNVGIQILKVEDARAYDAVLENLMKSPNADIRKRAALAAGRIGREEAVPALTRMLGDSSPRVREMAAFALGEIESMTAADAILQAIGETARAQMPGEVGGVDRSRLVEAAGKIAAANAKDPKAKDLARAVVFTLEAELAKGVGWSKETILLGLTAALRARPDGAEETVRKFLAFTDPDIVASALNTLARLRAKNANRDARDLLATSPNAIVRANAACVLGAAEDKEAVDRLIKAASSDGDLRVRVSAIRALASIKDVKSAESLVKRGNALFDQMKLPADFVGPWYGGKPRQNQTQRNELLELASALAKILPNTDDMQASEFLKRLDKTDRYTTPEVLIALADISPGAIENLGMYTACYGIGVMPGCEKYTRNRALALAEFAKLPSDNDFHKKALNELEAKLERMSASVSGPIDDQTSRIGVLEAYSAFKDAKPEFVIPFLKLKYGYAWDPFVRAAAAGIIADQPATSGAVKLLSEAFVWSLANEKHDNDAQLAMLDAMAKINKAAAVDTIYMALDAPDYLVRKKAFELLDDPELIKKNPGVISVLKLARENHKDEVWPYDPKSGTKLGQVLNKDADYRRALSRKNGRVKAVVTTEKGAFTINLLPEDAPLTVDNFIKLARANYFNGLEVHRVVPNFVVQDGDPRGDGNGGPGWSIRCEINMVPYERGAVGMALSGKDTGGSQWFVTHSPQPHLDGGYTVFGRVNETGMKVVDKIVRGDKILSIRVVDGLNRRDAETRRKK